MDPSKNNSFGSSDSGGINPSNVGTPNDATSAGGGSVVNPIPDSAVASNPAPNVVSNNMGQTGPMPINNARRFGSIPTGSMTSNPMPINSMPSSPMATNSMQSNPMATNSFSMMNGPMPVASGTGDIVLSKDSSGKNPKKWWIIGGAVGAVIVMVLVVFAIMGTGGGFGAKATDLRSAFNIYANYFLTGEAKNEDLPEEADAEKVVEDLEEYEGVPEDVVVIDGDSEEIVYDESGVGPLDDTSENNEEDVLTEESSYFYENVGLDESEEYRTNLQNYFNDFYDYYVEVWKDDKDAIDFINDYKNIFDLVMIYYDSDSLTQSSIMEAYEDGGEDAAKEYVIAAIEPYKQLTAVYDVSYYGLANNYGLNEISLIKRCKEKGCLEDGEIDYDCLGSEADELMAKLADLNTQMTKILESSESDLYLGIYSLKSLAYTDLDEDEGEEGGNDEEL